MRTYRYGRKENIVGSSWYTIDEKKWWGWKTYLTFGSKSKMLQTVEKLEKIQENILINININA